MGEGGHTKKIRSTDHVIDIESFCLPPAHLKLKSRVFSNSFSSFLLLKQRWVLKCELKKTRLRSLRLEEIKKHFYYINTPEHLNAKIYVNNMPKFYLITTALNSPKEKV